MSLAGRWLDRSALMVAVKSAVRRLLAACLLAASVVLVAAPTSGAATAAPGDCLRISPADAAEAADAVFTGVVISVRRTSKATPNEAATFANEVQVELVFKGAIRTTTVPVATRGSTRTLPGLGALTKGERYLFFGRALDSTSSPAIVSGGCSGTGVAVSDQVTRVEELLGEGQPPVPPEEPEASFARVDDTDPTDFTRSAAPGLALVLVGLLGLVVVRRLGRRA